LQEEDEDLKMPEALSFLKSQGFSKITLKMDNPYPVYYSKMLKVCLAMTIDEHLLQCTKFLPSLIIPLNVKWLILAGFSPKIEKEFLFLEDIMEAQVEEKYFLSEKTTSKFKTLNKNQIKKLKKLNVDSSVSGTLTEAFGRGGSSAEYLKMLKKNKQITGHIRKLTPIECERLQGFPDNWTDGQSDTQRYKQLGNAVSVPVIKAIVEKIYDL
jgi:hypothetical protein